MGSAGFEALLRRLALLVLQGLATVLAGKVELVDFLDLDGDAEAVEVVPARAPTLVFVGALHPAGVGDVLAADAFVLVFVFDFVDGLEGTVEGLVVVLVELVDPLALVFLLLVVEDDPFEVEGVEEGAFGEGGYLVGVDGADGVCVLPELDDLAVLRDFCDFGVASADHLSRQSSTFRNSFSSTIVDTEFFIFSKSYLYHGFAFISFRASSRCCGLTAMPNFRRASCSILGLPLIDL